MYIMQVDDGLVALIPGSLTNIHPQSYCSSTKNNYPPPQLVSCG